MPVESHGDLIDAGRNFSTFNRSHDALRKAEGTARINGHFFYVPPNKAVCQYREIGGKDA